METQEQFKALMEGITTVIDSPFELVMILAEVENHRSREILNAMRKLLLVYMIKGKPMPRPLVDFAINELGDDGLLFAMPNKNRPPSRRIRTRQIELSDAVDDLKQQGASSVYKRVANEHYTSVSNVKKAWRLHENVYADRLKQIGRFLAKYESSDKVFVQAVLDEVADESGNVYKEIMRCMITAAKEEENKAK